MTASASSPIDTPLELHTAFVVFDSPFATVRETPMSCMERTRAKYAAGMNYV
jgi:hypothetical protein